jgi:hypothetical protein
VSTNILNPPAFIVLAILASTGASKCPSTIPSTVTLPGDLSPGVTDTRLDSLSSEEDRTLAQISLEDTPALFLGSLSDDRALLLANFNIVIP